MYVVLGFFFFFFKQKTAYEMRISDWSSDVCSSDLTRGRSGWVLRRIIRQAPTAMKASSVPALASSARSPIVKKPAKAATNRPVRPVMSTGDPVRGDTLLAQRGRSPSRDITKKMRLWPYIITRITDGSATIAASATAEAAAGWSSARTTDRKSVVSGKSVAVRVDLGGRRIIKKKKQKQ